ncbi:DNA-processing protein DprA [Tepidiforma flava]|uniref:DNA-processing protein DprA n=1 Tax=Tepidiforma flava TaxID=3004094 RepID=A0ABY7MAW0_9CHLR|nr:DNA-processing protein DprA [Tepidiforma flava]WBL37397.1 DNA-processing protein DprA [Tepidiforma flava]
MTESRLVAAPATYSKDDPGYPERLRRRLTRPALLHVLGDLDLLSATPALAVAGSRAAPARSLEDAAQLGAECARRGWLVISGGARGVDTSAVEGALAAGGRAVVVLAEGIETGKGRALLRRFAGHRFAVVSQFAPRAGWKSWQAMARNGLILAFSDALVAVAFGEGGERPDSPGTLSKQALSGTLDAVIKATGFAGKPGWEDFAGAWSLSPIPRSERQPVDGGAVHSATSPAAAIAEIAARLVAAAPANSLPATRTGGEVDEPTQPPLFVVER